MITGLVAEREARVRLKVRGARGRQREIEAVIDTGYTASLTLPPSLVEELRLRWQSLGRGTLADGSECLFDVYEATVVWDRRTMRILVDEADTDPLVVVGARQRANRKSTQGGAGCMYLPALPCVFSRQSLPGAGTK